jgi:VWFA-related protein
LGRVEAKDGTSQAGAQAASQGEPPRGPAIQVYSRETVVDVEVIDDKGQPVRGLSQADFTVKENGTEQGIRSFKEYGGSPTDAGPMLRQQAALPEEVHTNRETPTSGPVNILLIDALNASPVMVMFVQEETLKYLETMPEGTQVAVFWLSQGGLHLLQGFTQDRKLLIGAVSRTLVAQNRLEVWTKQWLTVDGMDEIAMYVSKIKGRKNLIWFTPGMPIRLVRDGGYSWGDSEGPDMGLVHRLMDAYELLSQAQVAICPVDPRGVGAAMSMQSLLVEEVAEESGGTAYYNTNGLAKAMETAIATGSNYYTISYVPPGKKNDGRFHHIWVGVDRPGVRLVYRKGYDSEDPLAAHAIAPGPGLKKAVMAGRAMVGAEMQFDVTVQPIPTTDEAGDGAPAEKPAAVVRRELPKQGAKPGVKYGFTFAVPVNQIAFTQGADGMRTASLEFDVSSYSASGAMTNDVSEITRLRLSGEEYAEFVKMPYHYYQQLELPMGEAIVRVGVLDDVSKRVGTMAIPLKVVKEPGVAEAGR